ncbi:MAG: hypothetical protein HY651_11680 [Acidobacteria bacterium]|nr:hypothetical protein [Acidobacteriota bacterium]
MELMILAALCALVGLGCLAGAVWAIVGGEDVGVELIFLLHVWLLLAALFLGMAVWIARQGPLRHLGQKGGKKKTSTETEDKSELAAKAAS